MAASLLELINSTNYAIIDIEGIQLEKNRDLWKGREGLDHLNLELIDIPVAPFHNPLEEVRFYRNCLDNKMDSIGLISRHSLL